MARKIRTTKSPEERRAEAEGVPVSEVIREALRHHLKAS